MRTVYLGTSPFAAAVLRRLAASPHAPALVVTRPDRPAGRGRKLSAPAVAGAARDLGIDVTQPTDVNAENARAQIAAADPEALVVCAFGALLGAELLAAHEVVNVHPSLLPRWRGAAPIERAIEAGDEETGVAIMRPVAELDAGPVFAIRSLTIAPGDDFASLAAKLEDLSGELLTEVLGDLPEPAPQPGDGVTYAEKISRADRVLDPARPALELERRVRALHPHIGAFAVLPGGEPLGVLRARVAEEGEGLRRDGERLLLGGLELLEVRPPGGRAMAAAEWLRGKGRTLVGET